MPRYERTRQYLTADESDTITTTVPEHELRRPGLLGPAGNLVFEGRGSTRYKFVAATSGACRGDADVGQAIVDRRTGAVLKREVGQADGSFTEVGVLSQFQTLPLTPRTRKLLAFGSHHRAKLVGNVGRSFWDT